MDIYELVIAKIKIKKYRYKVIPRIKLVANPETEEAKSVIGYKWNEHAGKRHFLGGKPNNVEENDYPNCKDCGEKMTFYSQIDSIGENFDLADCMVIHTYVCFDCFTVESQICQSLS